MAENWMYFGDGYTAKYDRKKYIQHPDGTTWVRFIIQPGADIVEQYNLDQDRQYTSYGRVIREYLSTHVIHLREQVGFNKVLILVSFDGEETPVSQRDQHLVEQITNLERTLKSLKIGNARMHREYRGAMNNVQETVKKNVDLVNEARRGAQQMGGTDAESEEGQ